MPDAITFTPQLTDVTGGLLFPEGPIAMPDGTVLLVEMFGPRLTRVHADGSKETVAEIPGGPNGAAIGPDGAVYVCNNGGCFTHVTVDGFTFPGPFDPGTYLGGRIQRVDLHDGTVTDLYTECDGRPLRAPNDLVFDGHGGMWFTDHGIRNNSARTSDLTAIYWARVDGSEIREVVFPVEGPNGIGLSPDGATLYWAETFAGRVQQRTIVGPGEVAATSPLDPTQVLHGLPGYQLLDSLAVDGDGYVCVATLANGGVTAISPDGATVEHHATLDPLTTNVCFGGEDLSTAFVTLSATGRLVSFPWPRAGLRLAHQ
jgi:gluconolactonase